MVRLVQRATGMTGTDLLRELARLSRQRFRGARERMAVCLDSVVRWADADVAIWLEPVAGDGRSGWEVVVAADRADFIRAGEFLPSGLGGVEDRMLLDPGRLVLGPSEFPERQPLLLCRWAWQDAGWVAVQDDRLRPVGVLGIGFRSGVRGGMWTAPLVAAVELLAQNCALRPTTGEGLLASPRGGGLPADRAIPTQGPIWERLGERGAPGFGTAPKEPPESGFEAIIDHEWPDTGRGSVALVEEEAPAAPPEPLAAAEPDATAVFPEPAPQELPAPPPGLARALENAVIERQFEDASRRAHEAMQRAAAIGNPRLGDLAADMERAAASKDLLSVVDLLRPVVDELRRGEDRAGGARPGGAN